MQFPKHTLPLPPAGPSDPSTKNKILFVENRKHRGGVSILRRRARDGHNPCTTHDTPPRRHLKAQNAHPAGPSGANTEQIPICGKSKKQNRLTYAEKKSARQTQLPRDVRRHPQTHTPRTLLEPTQNKILFVGNRAHRTDQHILKGVDASTVSGIRVSQSLKIAEKLIL